MSGTMPQIKHVYQNHHMDSTRWQRYIPRDDDIIIATSIKSGTTWMQNILTHLILGGGEENPRPTEVSPWLEARMRPIEEVAARLEAQRHRRFIKTHLPLDGLPFYPEAKYLVVGRDARDVFMSLWNHYRNYTPEFYKILNEDTPGLVGDPMPQCPEDIGVFWYRWITQGWFEWEREGYPFWSNLDHTETWWQYRGLPNVLFVHFSDLLKDLEGEIRRVAKFLNIHVTDDCVSSTVHASTFTTMKANADNIAVNGGSSFKGGAQAFVYKGTNGRWRDVLSPEDLSLHKDAVARMLSPICAHWLENGRLSDQSD